MDRRRAGQPRMSETIIICPNCQTGIRWTEQLSALTSADGKSPETRRRSRGKHRTEPRVFTRAEAMRYTGSKSLSAFHYRIKRGLLPRPIPGTRTWDRKAIDAALDRLSALASNSPRVSPLEEWRAGRARKS